MNILQQLSDEMADTTAAVTQAVVQIQDRQGGVGSGTIWNADGLIITNAHVVLRGHHHMRVSHDLSVLLPDGRTRSARVVAVDEENDLAALQVDVSSLPVVTIGDSASLRPGQWVMAIGHPWGVRNALTAGVIIGTGDDMPEIHTGREWIALDLQLRPGHSGGPLVDVEGRVVGINTMISGPEVGFAIPVDKVKAFLQQVTV